MILKYRGSFISFYLLKAFYTFKIKNVYTILAEKINIKKFFYRLRVFVLTKIAVNVKIIKK